MSDQKAHLRDWLTLLHAPQVGSSTLIQLLRWFGSAQDIISATGNQLAEAGLKKETIEAIQVPDQARLEATLQWQEQPQAHILTLDDSRYPPQLLEIPDPPALLFAFGDPGVLLLPQLAMVGSRNTSHNGKETAYQFARHLSQQGLTITSGLAQGIDAASHEGALAVGGKTVAVTGTGLDRVYPAKHRELAHKIAENGVLVSEFPIGTPPMAGNFPRRNRIISGLSKGVLVVEAAVQSGSLITARLALEQGREVLAVPGSIHNPQARGCNLLIRQGAKLVETAQDVIEELPEFTWSDSMEQPESGDSGAEGAFELDEEYQVVLKSVDFEPTSVDKVVERSGLTADAVCSMLLVLELQGLVTATSGGHYCQVAQ